MPRYHNDLRNYNGQKFDGLTVADLRELLADAPADAIVVFTSDYGDYHHTQQALPLKHYAEATVYDASDVIEKSGYSHSGFQFNDPDDRDDDGSDEDLTDEELAELQAAKADEDKQEVVVIRLG